MSRLKTYIKDENHVKSTYLNDGLGSLSGSQGNDVLASVHQDALSFHWLSFELEIVGGVNDCAIL